MRISCRDAYLLVIILLVVGVSSLVAAQQKAPSILYDSNVRIEPASGWVFVHTKVNFALESSQARSFKFNLHETFSIKKLLVNGSEASFSSAANPSVLTPAAKAVSVTLPASASGNVEMVVEYEGKLIEMPEWGAPSEHPRRMDDQVNTRMIELAGYSSWYPQFDFGQPIQSRFELSLPKGWVSICSGVKKDERVQGERVITQWFSKRDLDLLVAASPNYIRKSARQSNVNIEIYHTKMPQDFIDHEVGEIAGAVRFYTEKLGDTNIPGGTVRQVYSPKRFGQGKAGIARPGLFVTSEGLTLESIANEPGFSLFQPISHEIAHSWWNFGMGQGDWINEAFAEYFSALAVQKISGDKEFKNVLDDYRKQVHELPADAPPLSTVPFLNDENGFVVRYFKGALMLDNLRQVMGDERFFTACRDFFQKYTGGAIGTAEFRSFWKERLGTKQEVIDTWIDSKGGLPAANAALRN